MSTYNETFQDYRLRNATLVRTNLDRELRSRRMSRADLARAMGIDESTLSTTLKLDNDMKLSTVFRMAFVIGVDPAILFLNNDGK